ncbi:MAG: 3-dehydroquinate synthase [Acidobacteriota bacterium]
MSHSRPDGSGGDLPSFAVSFAFPLIFTTSLFQPDNPVLATTMRRLEPDRRHRALFVVDDAVARTNPGLLGAIAGYVARHAGALELAGQPMVVTGGEAVKNDFSHTLELLTRINEVGLDRQAFVVVIGGGAVLDMASFAAAIAHRGIRVVRVPTTVLAQGDSGVGVKNGINFFGKKNFIGSFAPPFAVINDIAFLHSLPRRDRVAGAIEAVKVALLKDRPFFEFLEARADRIAAGDLDVLAPLVRRSAELHVAHICGNGDPFELGSARPLDFGHWAAHRLESMTAHRLRHGEAVAIGIALDVVYSARRGFLAGSVADRILDALERMGFALWDEALQATDAGGQSRLLAGLREFREHLGGELHVTLLRDIGHGFEVTAMDEADVLASMKTLAARQTRTLESGAR